MVYLREPPRSGFELSWRIFGIRVRVFPSFFIVTALIVGILIWLHGNLDPVTMAFVIVIDVACLFAALLFVGYVQGLVYRSYGIRSTILVRELIGGIVPDAEPPTVIQRIAVALANPASSFLLWAIVYYSNQEWHWSKLNAVTGLSYFILWAISLFWGIIGLLPVYPYSGGRVMLEVLTLLSPRNGLTWTLMISVLVGIAYVAYTGLVYFRYMREIPLVENVTLPANIFVAFFFALSVMNNWQTLQIVRAHRPGSHDVDYEDDRAPWER